METKARGRNYIRVPSIIMIIYAVIGVVTLININYSGMLIFWAVLFPILYLLTGVVGLINCEKKDSKSMNLCLVFVTLLLIVMVLDIIIAFILYGAFALASLGIIRFLFPILYIMGINMNKKTIDMNDFN